MHPDFAEWYRELSIEPDRGAIELRWKGVEKLASAVDKKGLMGLIRIFYGMKNEDENFLDSLREPFLKADPTFRRHGNDAELSVLAGAALVNLMGGDNVDLALAAALLLITSSFGGPRTGSYNRSVVAIARRTLDAASAELRESVAPTSHKMPGMKWDTAALTTTPSLVGAELDKVASYSRALHTQLGHWADYVTERMNLMQEELDIAWWLLGGASSQVEVPISRLPKPAAPIIVGCELASMVKVLPGPRASTPFLQRMLGANVTKSIDLGAAIFSAAAEGKLQWPPVTDDDALMDILPLTASLARAREGAPEEEWVSWAGRSFSLDLPSSFEPISLAKQAYRECLAIAAVGRLANRSGDV